jgi:hypothetical protein
MTAPPEKGTGALLEAPIPTKLNRLETTAPPAPPQACEHRATVTERLPDCHQHHTRLTCALCGRFLRWLPRPETIERERVNAFRLVRLGMCEGLSKWERSFVNHVSQQRKLSPKQAALLARLYATYLETQT